MACITALISTDGAPVDEAILRALMDVEPYRRPADYTPPACFSACWIADLNALADDWKEN